MSARAVRVGLACAFLLFALGPLTADRQPSPDVSLSVPIAVAKGGRSICGLTMSNDLRARFRARGGNITVEWRSSSGHGNLTRTSDVQGFDAAFDMAGLGSGAVALTGVVTIGGDPLSSPVGSTVFTLTASPMTATAQQGTSLIPTLTVSPGTVALSSQPATWQWINPVDGGTIQQGSFPTSAFQLDNSGNLVAQPAIPVPGTFLGQATLQFTVGVQSTDLFGNPITVSTSTAMKVTVQSAAIVPLVVAFTTPAGIHFSAGTNAAVQFTVQTSDPTNTTASFTVTDSTGHPVASGAAVLAPVDATHLSGTATWAVPPTSAGNFTMAIVAQRTSGIDVELASGSLPVVVDAAAGPTLTISQAGPVTTTAGQPATVNFTIQNVASLAGATLAATFTDRSTGLVVLTSSIDPATLVKQQDGSLAGSFTFTFPQAQVNRTLDTTLTITLLMNAVSVASGSVEVIVQPAALPVSVAIVSAPSQVTAGTQPSLAVGVTGVTAAQVSSLFWSLLDAQGNTAATENIPTSLLQPVGAQLEAKVQMNLSSTLAAGAYTLQVTMVTTAGQTYTASQAMQVLTAISMRFTVADGDIVEGQAETIEAVLRPQITVGGASWYFLNGLGTVAAGFPTGTLASSDFIPIVDNDGTPAWLLRVTTTVPVGAVSVATSVSFVLTVTDTAGRVLASGQTTFMVQPVAPVISQVQPAAALPGTRVGVSGSGFQSSGEGSTVVLTPTVGAATEVRAIQVSPGGDRLVFEIPLLTPVGDYALAVRTAAGLSNAFPIHVMDIVEVALPALSALGPLLNSPDPHVVRDVRHVLALLFGEPSHEEGSFARLLEAERAEAAAAVLKEAIDILLELAETHPEAQKVAMALKDMLVALVRNLIKRAESAGQGNVSAATLQRANELLDEALRLEANGDIGGATRVLVQAVLLLHTVLQPGRRGGGFSGLGGGGACGCYAVLLGPDCLLLNAGNSVHHTYVLYYCLHCKEPGETHWSPGVQTPSDMGLPVVEVVLILGDAILLDYQRPGRFHLDVTYQPSREDCAAASDHKDVVAIDFRISKCPNDYVPNPENGKNRIGFTATIRPEDIKANITFQLWDVSTEPGTCGNFGRGPNDDTNVADLHLPRQPNFDPPAWGLMPRQFDTIRSSHPVNEITVQVQVDDYGAYGRIEAHAHLCDQDSVAHTHPDGQDPYQVVEQFSMIPRDDLPRDHIPDKGWDAVISDDGTTTEHVADEDLPLDNDSDAVPQGAGVNGDLLGRFVEYRGFMVGGRHIRTSPYKKDVFVFDKDNILGGSDLGHGYFTTPTLQGAAVHYLTDGEVDVNTREIAPNAQTGKIAGALPQRALIVEKADLSAEHAWGRTGPSDDPLPPAQIGYVRVDANRMNSLDMLLYRDISADSSIMTVQMGHPEMVVRNPKGELRVDDEIIHYETTGWAYTPDRGIRYFDGLRRGQRGTVAAPHVEGRRIPFWAEVPHAIGHVFAHELGHAVAMQHQGGPEGGPPFNPDTIGTIATIMKYGLWIGEYDGHYLSQEFNAESIGQFRTR